MDRQNRKNIKILYIATNEIKLLDIPRALDILGYDVFHSNIGTQAMGYNEDDVKRLVMAIDELKMQIAISYDFSENIAQACYETGIPYISWVYDAPQKELYTHYAFYPCNYIFVFDKKQMERLKNIGLKNVFYMPLAIMEEKVEKKLTVFPHKYKNEITFVGQLYRKKETENLLDIATKEIREDLESSIQKSFLKWNENVQMHGTMTDSCVNFFGEFENHIIDKQYPYMTERMYYEAAVLSRFLANRERVYILNNLSKKHNVYFYTNDEDISQLDETVIVAPGMQYDGELPVTYYTSKINLNITLHCIEEGASQRVFDVMAAGGFLISNYQKSLEELFVPGEDLIIYHDYEELDKLVDYYLEHDEERERIAANGQRKVLEHFEYKKLMDAVIDIVVASEKDREEHYLVTDARNLYHVINQKLKQNSQDDIDELYKIITDERYSLIVKKTEKIGMLREMLYCHELEMQVGNGSMFENIHTLDEANLMYTRLRHMLWRIEQGLSEDKCIDGMKWMLQENIAPVFIVWQIHANMDNAYKILSVIINYFKNININKSLEIISYAQLWFSENTELFIHKADCLIMLGMWKEALDVLKQIPDANSEIEELINNIEGAIKQGN